jgi:hypothetical protein
MESENKPPARGKEIRISLVPGPPGPASATAIDLDQLTKHADVIANGLGKIANRKLSGFYVAHADGGDP